MICSTRCWRATASPRRSVGSPSSLRLGLCSNYFVVIVRTGERVLDDAADQMPAARQLCAGSWTRRGCICAPRAGALLVGIRHGEVVALHPFEDPSEGKDLRAACTRLAEELAALQVTVG